MSLKIGVNNDKQKKTQQVSLSTISMFGEYPHLHPFMILFQNDNNIFFTMFQYQVIYQLFFVSRYKTHSFQYFPITEKKTLNR